MDECRCLFVQISFNPSSPSLRPSIYPPITSMHNRPPTSPPTLPASSRHLPPQECNTGRLSGEERVKQRGWAPNLSVGLGMCVCVLRLNTLCGVCVRLCASTVGGGGVMWEADGQPLLSLVLSTPSHSSPALSFYPSLFPHLSPLPVLPLSLPSFHAPFFFITLFSPLSCGRWQHGAAAAAEARAEEERKRGFWKRGGGERRWGSGIWRAWLRGPLRGSVYVSVVV